VEAEIIDSDGGHKMKVFFCWSGDQSKMVAEVLASWIGQVIQAVEPWISTGISKGKRWQQEIGDHLEDARAGVVCLTRDIIDSAWIHYESGALAKSKEAYLYTFLLDLQVTDIKEPLSWFQSTKGEEGDVRKLIHDLNKLVGETGGRTLSDKDIDELFDYNWPRLDEKLQELSRKVEPKLPARSEREMIQETLQAVRELGRMVQDQAAVSRDEWYRLLAEDRSVGPSIAVPSLRAKMRERESLFRADELNWLKMRLSTLQKQHSELEQRTRVGTHAAEKDIIAQSIAHIQQRIAHLDAEIGIMLQEKGVPPF
jgi:hypothetical protein